MSDLPSEPPTEKPEMTNKPSILDGCSDLWCERCMTAERMAAQESAAPSVSSSAPPEKRPITSWERIPTEGEGPDDRAFWHLIEWARAENRRPDRGGIVLEDATIDAAVRCALELPVLRRELASLAKFAETDCARALHTVAHLEAEIRRLRAGDRA